MILRQYAHIVCALGMRIKKLQRDLVHVKRVVLDCLGLPQPSRPFPFATDHPGGLPPATTMGSPSATAHFASSQVLFSPDMDPIEYEQMVADSLTDLGWQTWLTKASGDQGIDVIAEMRGQRVAIQCMSLIR